LHRAGAIVRHKSKFADLTTPINSSELTEEFIKKWVVPYYMIIGDFHNNDLWQEQIVYIHDEITPEITLLLLGDFNWRTRLVGAYFSAVKNYTNQIDIIGTLFLKSEVCCVGHIYALVLAFYNTDKTNAFLNEYLDYYLQMPHLYFDQESVLSAIKYLDKVNKTNNLQRHLANWAKYQKDKEILTQKNAISFAKFIEDEQGKEIADDYLKSINKGMRIETEKNIKTEYTEKQINILAELNEYCR
jgi:hypothetical protein